MAAVAHTLRQEDIHPLLRHPKPIKRDTAKAHRMLGLVAHDEERIKSLQREKSITTRWLERPMYEHLEVSDIDSERDDATRTQKVDSVHEERKDDDDDDSGDELSPALQSWLKPERPVSFGSEASVPSPLRVEKTKLDTSFLKRRPQPIDCPRPLSYTAQHLLNPEWTTSPSTMSPMSPNIARRPVSLQPNSPLTRQPMISSNSFQESIRKVETSQSLQIPPFHESENASGGRPTSLRPDCFVSNGSPMADKPRPRPTSFATFPHQNKRNSKIASSRGLRNNSYPNFSRPISDAPKVVPGEQMENDFIYQRFHDDEVGPPSPVSPIRHALDGFEAVEKTESRERKPKKRWSAIPLGIKNFARRRSSAAQEPPNDTIQATSIESLRQMNLTKENLQWYQNEMQEAVLEPAIVETTVVSETRMSAADLLPTPKNSPFDLKHPLFEAPLPLPFAPWADSPPSPASSSDNRRGSQSSTHSSKRKSSLSIETVPQHQPVSPSSPRISQPVTHLPPVSTAPQPRLTPASPFIPDTRGADSPRTATSSRRGTPLLERTCIICQTRKQPTAFLDRRITSNCWHEPATCRACLQSWVDTCLITEDWSQCTCPECGENMDRADITVWSQEGMI